jgi:hypothetical protein
MKLRTRFTLRLERGLSEGKRCERRGAVSGLPDCCESELFDTPALIEVWRTTPYLHDGPAAKIRDVLTVKNPKGDHGKTSHLTQEQIGDLAEYVLSL